VANGRLHVVVYYLQYCMWLPMSTVVYDCSTASSHCCCTPFSRQKGPVCRRHGGDAAGVGGGVVRLVGRRGGGGRGGLGGVKGMGRIGREGDGGDRGVPWAPRVGGLRALSLSLSLSLTHTHTHTHTSRIGNETRLQSRRQLDSV
jgi:hypothetical protein